MAENTATDAAGLESSLDFSMVQHNENEDAEGYMRITGSSNDLSLLQNVSTSTTIGGGGGGGSKGRLDSLKENLSKQQDRLLELRERAQRRPSNIESMESLKVLGQKLTVLKARSGGGVAVADASTPLATPTKDTMDKPLLHTSASEKLLMLTQRTEQNRALLEQRKQDMAKSLLSIRSSLSQSQSQGQGHSFSHSRTTAELGSSMTDLRHAAVPEANATVSRHRSALDLQQQQQQQPQQADALDETRMKLLKNRMKITELKQSRQEQEVVELRQELARRASLIEQLELSGAELQRTLTRRDEELEQLRADAVPERSSLQEQEHSRLHSEVVAMKERLSELENINDMLETTRCELTDELSRAREQLQQQQEQISQSESTNTEVQVNEELAKQLSALQAAYDELRREADSPTKLEVNDSNVSERLIQLEATIAAQCTQLEQQKAAMAEQGEELAEKTTELNVLNVNLRLLEEKLAQSSRSKPLFLDEEDHSASEQLREELQHLKQKLDESNKANIKLKLKCKQAEKQLQKMQSEDSQQKLTALAAQNEELQQRITVLEDEKGQWQLSNMQEEGEGEEQTQHEINPLQREAVRLLEEQKMELQQALEALQQGNESARVESELSEVHMEEQLSQRVQQLEQQAQEQIDQIQTLQAEKEVLDKKLSRYVNENMELLDKLEKISSSSSAESIEIVERPSQQQLESFEPRRPASEGDAQEQKQQQQQQQEEQEAVAPIPLLPSVVSELTQTDLTPDASESLNQLREERSELLQRIELFSNERREVLEKMEQLMAENGDFQARLDDQKEQQQRLQADNSRLESRLIEGHQEKEDLQREKEQLSMQLSERSNLSQELSSMQRSSEVVAALDAGEGGPALFDKCERSLSKLNSELEAYRKADRQAKINASKKLAKEAKNCHTQLTELLQKVKEASTAVETVTVVETVVAVTAPNGKALAEYEKLTAQNAELKAELSRLRRELEEVQDSYEPEAPQLAIAAVDEQQSELAQELQQLQTTLKELQSQESVHRKQIEEHVQTIADLRSGESEHLQLIASQEAKLTQLQLQLEQLHQVLNTKEMAHEKYMEQQTRIRRELGARADSMEGEMSILQALVAEQKQQLIENLSESEHTLNLKILELQTAQAELRELRSKEEDPGHLKESLRVSKSLAAQQVSELATKQETIEALNQQLQELYQGLDQAKQEEQHKHRELREKLKKYALNLKKRSQENAELEQRLKELTERPQETPIDHEQVEKLQEQVAHLNEELKAKIHVNLESRDAQRQLRQQLQEQEHLLQQRDEEQQRLQVELQNTVRANTELRREQAHWEQQQTEQEHSLADLYRQLEQKSIKFDKSKEVIKHRNATIQALQRELQQLRLHAEQDKTAAVAAEEPRAEEALLRAQLQAAQEQHSLLAQQYARDKADFQVTIGRLETIHGGIQAKLQQDASYIESLESQNTELLAKSVALEEQMTSLANQLAAAQDRASLFEQQLHQNSSQQKEHESELRERVRELGEREQAHNRQIELISSESEDAREQLVQVRADYEALRIKHGQLMAQAQAERETLSSHSEQELADLREQLALRESELQRQRQVYDAKLAAKATELDEIECDLNAHMERSTAESRVLTQQLERAHEQIKQRGEDLSRITEELQEVERERSALSREVTLLRLQQDSAEQDVLELQELRMQVIQDKTEMDNLRSQIDSLCANHTQELQLLQQQIAEWDTLGQNQTDDQVYIETENKRLTEQLIELQARLEEQAAQLAAARQSSAEASVPAPAPAPAASFFFASDAATAPSPFDEIIQPLRVSSHQLSAAPPSQSALPPPPTIEDLQRNVSDLEKHAQDLETKLVARNQSVSDQERRLAELERLLHEREQQLAEIRAAEEERERLAALEKLIQPTGAPSLDMFFGVGGPEESVPVVVTQQQLDWGQTQAEPVVEEIITPKKAYVCHPQQEQEQEQQLAVDWGVDEDPWASAAAQATQDSNDIRTQPDVEAMHARIGQLERQLATAEQQKAELQMKTAKLLKRLKEYKSKALAPVTTSDNDLDGAIIEELKHQLQLQEARQAKSEELVQQHALEKEKLCKRIDVLTAGNDRMAELKERQDRDVQMYQARIRELQEKLNQMDQWDVPAATAPPLAVAPSSSDAESLIQIENLQAENVDLNAECQELQSQLREERRQAQLAEETAAQAQAQREELREYLQQLQAELDELRGSQVEANELQSLKLEVEQLRSRQSELEELRAQKVAMEQCLSQRQAEIEELRQTQRQSEQSVATSASLSDEQMAQLQEKESEIVHLKQRIEELMREDQTEKLVFEILTKNQELQLLRLQIKQLQEEREEVSLPAPVAATETDQELQQLRVQCQQMQLDKSDMEEELRVLNNHVLSSLELEDKMKHTVFELDTKNIEIAELRKSLEMLQQSQSSIPDLDALNQQWESLVEQKCGEVANIWQDHLSQREAAFKAQLEQVQQQHQQQQYPTEAAAPQSEDNDSLMKMQKALETQEMEIVTLKEQLAIRSAEYARLAAQYDPFRLQHQGAGGATGVETQSEYVLKADLDYALMMLHQRDMRVEEMILELGQLLQERDHLQLKLSDTLRQLETERVRSSDDPAVAASAVSSASTPRKTSNASSTDLAVVTNTRGSDLKQKLAELQTVRHSKDKAIVDEREQRLQQMVQLQRDMAKQASGSAAVTTVTPFGTPTAIAAASPPPPGVDHSQPTPRSPTMGLMDWILGNKSEDDSQHASN
ncbi:protein lava lamp isoform X1 [Drosophila guanche]|uniref:Blast:Teneurin-4 n=1 Tax=Drosophila guanche TaxID=7266 RepID=A0A3B0J0W9_DROGU|nr:protein lava lamp isoform X1 [Drosophila guanche]SPP74417.1 blast:Teneurin-4 [Drosophila guanche]